MYVTLYHCVIQCVIAKIIFNAHIYVRKCRYFTHGLKVLSCVKGVFFRHFYAKFGLPVHNE